MESPHPFTKDLMRQGEETLKQFGNQVRELRTELGISQEAFADMCELDRTYISGIERGKRNVSLLNIVRLAKALGVSVAELMKPLA